MVSSRIGSSQQVVGYIVAFLFFVLYGLLHIERETNA